MNNLVFLEYLNDYDFDKLKTSVEEAFRVLNINTKALENRKILIKACLNKAISKDMAETTHPSVVRAVAEYLNSKGAKCIVADCPEGKHSLEYLENVYFDTGMLDMANLTNCELNHNLKTTELEMAAGVKTKGVKVLDLVKNVDAIINIGKLKFDENLGYLGTTSNIFAIIPGELKNVVLNRQKTLSDFDDYIIDLYEAVKDKVVLNVIDAVVCTEAGDTQRMLNCFGASTSAYALDAVMFDILGIKFSTTLLKQAKTRNLFDFKKPYKIVGEKLEKFKVQDFQIVETDGSNLLNRSMGYFKSHQMRPRIDKNKCKGCKICSKICPSNAILMKYDNRGELYAEIDYDKCIFCNKCVTACPYSVVEMKVPMKYKAIIKDVEKYNE